MNSVKSAKDLGVCKLERSLRYKNQKSEEKDKTRKLKAKKEGWTLSTGQCIICKIQILGK